MRLRASLSAGCPEAIGRFGLGLMDGLKTPGPAGSRMRRTDRARGSAGGAAGGIRWRLGIDAPDPMNRTP